MSHVYLRDLGFQRNQPEDREGLSRTRRPGRGHLGHSGGWKNNGGDNINLAINTPFQQEPQTTGLGRHGSSSSAPPTPQRFISMEHGQQEVQPGNSLGRAWSKLPEDLYQRYRLQGPYGNKQTLESYQEVQTPGGKGNQNKGESSHYQAIEEQLTQTGHTQIPSGSQAAAQISSPVASHHSETRRLVATSQHSSQLQEVSRRRQGNKDKNKTSFNQRKRESDPMILKLLYLVKELHKNQK
ncbi:hypothetical protein O181_087708 [Austropuccinia psidii MF-1]|uniref:Uncharacterized protein n=1 Tax=Austropuccinia psidii MF-1 TaxID=1389203 RepID=A0A9Q3IQ59_9BASI|nr:hypothetical protein [Austropuccinia psidii MF-1]